MRMNSFYLPEVGGQTRDVAKQRFGSFLVAFSFWCVLEFCCAFCSARFVETVGLAFCLLHVVATGFLRFEMLDKMSYMLYFHIV